MSSWSARPSDCSSADGFHASSVDAVADEAGYTKGAVYSNFAAKEELFFAVYERRVERAPPHGTELVEDAPSARAALEPQWRSARGRGDDGWLAVFFEFWAQCSATRAPGAFR